MSDEQNMDFDFSSAIEKIQEMMSSDEGQSKLNNIINAFVEADEREDTSAAKGNSGFPDLDRIDRMDMMIKLGKIMSKMKSESEGRDAALLYAIKPYLRESRREKTDSAVKIMGIIRALTILNDSGINLDF